MLQVTSQPSPLTLARNEVNYTFAAYSQDGTSFEAHNRLLVIRLRDRPNQSVGADAEFRLTFKDRQTRQNLTERVAMPTYQTGADFGAWVARVVYALQGNRNLSADFNMEVTPITTGNDAPAYDITLRPRYQSPVIQEGEYDAYFTGSFNMIFTFYAVEAKPNTMPIDYRVHYEVLFEALSDAGITEWHRVFFGNQPPLNNSTMLLNISDILSVCMQSEFDIFLKVKPYTTAFGFKNFNLRRFALRVTEFFDNQFQPFQELATRTAINGGIAEDMWQVSKYPDNKTYLNSWLTNKLSHERYYINQPLFISWLNPTAQTRRVSLKIYVRAISDFETGDYEVAPFNFTVAANETVTFNLKNVFAAYNNLAAAISICVFDVDNEIELSATRVYIPQKPLDKIRCWLYLNQFGMPETMSVRQDTARNLEIDKTDYKNFANGIAQSLSRLQNVKQTMLYRTGYMTNAQALQLQELLTTNFFWEVNELGYSPLRLTDSRFKLLDEDTDFQSLEISVSPIVTNQNYTSIAHNTPNFPRWQTANQSSTSVAEQDEILVFEW